MSSTADLQKFKSMQRQGWDSAASGWKKYWMLIEGGAHVVSEKLIELGKIQQGDHVLDIATGIGEPAVTAAKKVQPGGKVTAIDISPAMIAIARERAKENGLENTIEFQEADAESFDLPTSTYDAIVSRWGLMFMPDLPGALKAMREALVENGRIAAAVWAGPQKVPMLSLVFGTAMKELGTPPPPPGAPGPFSLADTNALREKFEHAGFQDVAIESGVMTSNFPSAEGFTEFHQAINAPVKMMMSGQSEARQKEIWDAITEAARKYADPGTGAVSLDNEVMYVSAKR